MRKFIKITLLLALMTIFMVSFAACGRQIPQKEKFDDTGYKETFFDDFNGTELNKNRWSIDTMVHKDKPHLNGIRRAGYYTEDSIIVKDGNLIIRTNYRKNGALGEGWYTGWIDTKYNTKDKDFLESNPDYVGLSQKYGYFEVRCICPPVNGIWSAFWMMPDNNVAFLDEDVQGTATDGAEIDIMESPKYAFNKTVNQHVVHMDGYDNRLKSEVSPVFKIPTMYQEFHTYGVEWTPEKLIFYIDGYKTYETPVKIKKKVFGVPKVNEYLILSVEVGGHYDDDGTLHPGVEKDGKRSWAGDPMFNNLDENYDFVIDYVKVLQKA